MNTDVSLFESRDKRMLAWLNGVNKKIKTARSFDNRVNGLNLLSYQTEVMDDGTTKIIEPSKRRVEDHPDVQLLLERRHRYEVMESEIFQLQEAIDGGNWEDDYNNKAHYCAKLAALRVQQEKELSAMEDKLNAIRKWSSDHWNLVAKILTDMRRFVQNDRHHDDKMRIMEKKTSMGVRDILADMNDEAELIGSDELNDGSHDKAQE